jgi:hypothetical protein
MNAFYEHHNDSIEFGYERTDRPLCAVGPTDVDAYFGTEDAGVVSCLEIGHRLGTQGVLAINGELRRVRFSHRRGHPGTPSVCTGVTAVGPRVVGRTTNSGAYRR